MRELTRIQQDAAELMSTVYGRSAVQPTVLNYATGTIILTGLSDDIERDKVVVRPDGVISACWDATSLFMDRYRREHADILRDRRPQQHAPSAVIWTPGS